MSIPHQVEQLVERFDRNRDAYLHGQYNEAMVRGEYIELLSSLEDLAHA